MKRSVRTVWEILVNLLRIALPALLLISCGGGQNSTTAPATSPIVTTASSITLTQVAAGFSNQVAITNAGDGSGRIWGVATQRCCLGEQAAVEQQPVDFDLWRG